MVFEVYRKGQGRITRGVSAGCLGFLLLLGCYQLYGFLVAYAWARDSLFGFVIPIVEQPLNIAILASFAVAAGGGAGLFWFLNRKQSVDLLVETETEMKKVTWPSWTETLNSAIVVILAVALIGVYLAFVDFMLGHFFTWIL